VKGFAGVFYVLDRIMYCTADPRLPKFYHHRYALGVGTAKLKSRGEEKKRLATNTLAVVKRQVAKMQVNIQSTVEKEIAGDLEIGGVGDPSSTMRFTCGSPWQSLSVHVLLYLHIILFSSLLTCDAVLIYWIFTYI
jgi:hypothetical protein